MKNQHRNNYSSLSEEYYDERAHPTCANLGLGSQSLLREWLASTHPEEAVICEIGAGRSALIEASRSKIGRSKLIITDSSEEMLSHSKRSRGNNVDFIVCDANNFPFYDESIDFIVSLLGDPYNQNTFWNEVFRTLKCHGRGIFTTPSWQWATKFRSKSARETHNEALFVTKFGKSVSVPSHVFSEDDQINIMLKSGIRVESVSHYTSDQLNKESRAISPKIGEYTNLSDPVVTAYHFSKL